MERNKIKNSDISIEEFQQIMVEEVKKELGEEYEVTKKDAYKNNGILYRGLTILKKDKHIGVIPYLEKYSDLYKSGVPIANIIKMLLSEILKVSVEENKILQQVPLLNDYEKVKDKIQCKLINTKANEEYLRGIPSIPFLDLSVIFSMKISEFDAAVGSIVIHNHFLSKWEITVEDLYRDAINNCHPNIEKMENVIGNMLKEEMSIEEMKILSDELTGKAKMFVMTNENKFNGANVMLCTKELEKFAANQDKNLFMIPSSTHEIIIIPDILEDESKKWILSEMVKEVNSTELLREEILSNSIYYFDRVKRKVLLLVKGEEIKV